MNESPPTRRTYLFTLRLWRQDLGDGRAEWRGQARRVLNGEVIHFREWAALREFLLKQLSMPEDADLLSGMRDDEAQS